MAVLFGEFHKIYECRKESECTFALGAKDIFRVEVFDSGCLGEPCTGDGSMRGICSLNAVIQAYRWCNRRLLVKAAP